MVVVLLGGLFWSAAAGKTVSAQHPRLIEGSLVLEDQRPLTVINVATGQVTVRLHGIYTEVGATSYGDVQAVPVAAGTMLINRLSGTFNLLGKDNYVLDAAGSGVGLGRLTGLTGASGLAAGAMAYVVRYAPHSTVSLVDEATVMAAAKVEAAAGTSGPAAAGPNRAVTPIGFAALGGPVADQPGSSAVSGSDLWTLVATGSSGSSCQVQQLQPVDAGHNGLLSTTRATIPTPCAKAAVEAVAGVVGVVTPGRVRLFPSGGAGPAEDVTVPGLASATEFLPVNGAAGTLSYLDRGPGGWSVFDMTTAGDVSGPWPLKHFGPDSRPVTPVLSGGLLYTLDQAAPGQPTLWTIVPATGAMIPVAGTSTYPARTAHEKASFEGAQVLVDGPRVVFNNPASLLAVVVFTDGTRPPVIVDKSTAMEVSTTGPADLNATQETPHSGGARNQPGTTRPVPGPQAVSLNVTCTNTTQQPYAPQISSVVPSSESALVAWSYQLLDQQDCEPDSWAVTVRAISSSDQPAQPVQVVNGQQQLEFNGLRPATTYQVVVTAYINAQSTPSTPATFTTAARGPDAPTAVHTTSDGKGDWVVSWTPCTSATCYVPADTWSVIGTACGSSFVGQPPTVQVPAGETTTTINADSLGLLGDSLSFSVQGVLDSGLTGNPTSDGSCTEAWRPPNPADISLAGSGRPNGQTLTATLQVSTGSTSPVEAFGSQNTEFVYHVGGITKGPTSALTVTVPGLPAGVPYTPTVSVYPAGEATAAVTVTGAPFSQDLSWPTSLGVAVSANADTANPNLGTIILTFPQLPPGPMSASSPSIQCDGGSAGTYPGGPLAHGILTISSFDLIQYGGDSCSLSVTVSDSATPNPYGDSSPPLQSLFTIGAQPGYTFTDQFPPNCQQGVCYPEQIELDSTDGQPTQGGDWTITASSGLGIGDPCAESWVYPPTQVPTFPVILGLPISCLDFGQVDIQVTYMYLGQTVPFDAGNPTGTPGTTTTTTTTAPTTTTTTTVPPTSSTSSTSSTTIDSGPTSSTSTTTSGQSTAAGPAGPPGTGWTSAGTTPPSVLAAAKTRAMGPLTPTLRGDPEVRESLDWVFGAAGVAWCVSWIVRGRRRRGDQRKHREQRKEVV